MFFDVARAHIFPLFFIIVSDLSQADGPKWRTENEAESRGGGGPLALLTNLIVRFR